MAALVLLKTGLCAAKKKPLKKMAALVTKLVSTGVKSLL